MAKTATGLTTPQPPPKLADSVLDLFSLKGKVAIVTGASSGIGFAVAEAFAQAGASLAVWYNANAGLVEQAKEMSEKYKVKVVAYQCSVNDEALVKKTVESIAEEFGKIDIFVANAGVSWSKGSLLDAAEKSADADEWNKVVETNFNGVYYCSKHIGAQFKKQKFGSMIITGSMSGHIVNVPQHQACYNATKAGVIHFAKSLAIEWCGFARVNVISPGYINTPILNFVDNELREKWQTMIPMGREGLPKELVGGYLYLASDASTYTTGSDLIIDGGYCVL